MYRGVGRFIPCTPNGVYLRWLSCIHIIMFYYILNQFIFVTKHVISNLFVLFYSIHQLHLTSASIEGCKIARVAGGFVTLIRCAGFDIWTKSEAVVWCLSAIVNPRHLSISPAGPCTGKICTEDLKITRVAGGLLWSLTRRKRSWSAEFNTWRVKILNLN
jgi:hypothetical protein